MGLGRPSKGLKGLTAFRLWRPRRITRRKYSWSVTIDLSKLVLERWLRCARPSELALGSLNLRLSWAVDGATRTQLLFSRAGQGPDVSDVDIIKGGWF